MSSTSDNDVTSTAPVFIIHVVPSTHTHPIIPLPVSTTSSHPMTTPSKFGISKKKRCFMVSFIDYLNTEPSSFVKV